MTTQLKLDFVADISCPWCVVGLLELRQALERLEPGIGADLQLQPFELNPDMEPGGRDLGDYLSAKYGTTPEQQTQFRDAVHPRGSALGFDFHPDGRGRIYNTFNAHRLLSWVGVEHPERQVPLNMALLAACHQERQPMDADDVLLAAVETAGLDREQAMDILASDAYANEVRQQEALYIEAGIRSVPTLIVNDRYVLTGAQPAEVLEQALRQIASETTA
ncbi:MAG TPA: DsbA family oxidoreductase [Macromonas sp.]|nr:DsbA family oxidoreductase [Macromonas sp.]